MSNVPLNCPRCGHLAFEAGTAQVEMGEQPHTLVVYRCGNCKLIFGEPEYGQANRS